MLSIDHALFADVIFISISWPGQDRVDNRRDPLAFFVNVITRAGLLNVKKSKANITIKALRVIRFLDEYSGQKKGRDE
jgi:hypothetical protein